MRCAQKGGCKRYKAYDSRGRISNKRNIADLPAEVETRETLGYWEVDTVMGKGSIPVAFHVATLLAAFAHPDHLLLVGSRGFAYLLASSNLKCFGSKH
ncbi:MAG: hypothetical protein QS721_00320 [Candidatus Endonucleobacter sp. (ex Gigantidas childressi)]|nr:hypothetical protein [Candidatus Endonucleobacter sp. (ex Gigantidas childressi)]